MISGTTEAWQNHNISMGAMGLIIRVTPAEKHSTNDKARTTLPSDLTLRPIIIIHIIIIIFIKSYEFNIQATNVSFNMIFVVTFFECVHYLIKAFFLTNRRIVCVTMKFIFKQAIMLHWTTLYNTLWWFIESRTWFWNWLKTCL